MSNEQFAALAQLLRMRDGVSQEAARLALVERLPAQEIVQRTGLTTAGVHNAIKRAKNGLALVLKVLG